MHSASMRRIGIISATAFFTLICLAPGRAAASLLDSLVAAWHFDGDLTDATGNGYDLTFAGTAAASYTGGAHNALALDGIDQHANVAVSGTALDFNASSFTIATWATVHSVPTARREAMIVGRPNNTSLTDYATTVDYNNQTDSSGSPVSYGYTGPGGGAGSLATTITYDAYVNLVLTYDHPTTTLTLYRNGSLRDTRTIGMTGPVANASLLEFGNFLGVFLKADLDEIEIYGASATQEQVTTLYNGGNGPLAIPEPTGFFAAAIATAFLANRRRAAR